MHFQMSDFLSKKRQKASTQGQRNLEGRSKRRGELAAPAGTIRDPRSTRLLPGARLLNNQHQHGCLDPARPIVLKYQTDHLRELFPRGAWKNVWCGDRAGGAGE
jgi:hypothetical protein